MNGIMRRIEQLGELSLSDWWLLLSSMVLLPLIAFALRMVGFKQTKKFMSYFMFIKLNFNKHNKPEIDKAYTIARMISVAASHGPYHANCLKQSLLLWWVLAKRGISSEIKFGVQKDSNQSLGAHAWVECNGVALINNWEDHQRLSAFV